MDDELDGFVDDSSYCDVGVDDSPSLIEDTSDTLPAANVAEYATTDVAEYPSADGVVTPVESNSASAGWEPSGYDDSCAPAPDPLVPDAAVPSYTATNFTVPNAAAPSVAVPDGGATGVIPVAPAAVAQYPQAASPSDLPPGAKVVATDVMGRPTHIELNEVVNPPTTMVVMGGNNPYVGTQLAGYDTTAVAQFPQTASAAGLPPGAEVIATDAAGRPTHIRLNEVVNPPTTMVVMGGNNPYVGTQLAGYDTTAVAQFPQTASASGLPAGAKVVATDAMGRPTHIELSQVVNPPTTMVDMGSTPYFTPPYDVGTQRVGNPAALSATLANGDKAQDLLTQKIYGVSTERNAAGDITGRIATDGSKYKDFHALEQQKKLDNGDPHPYSGPTIS